MKPDVMLPRNFPELLIIRHAKSSLSRLTYRFPRPPVRVPSFEERLEVTLAEALRAFALNDFEKQSWPVFHRLGKYLK